MKFITLFIILLISFNINANLVIKKKVAKFDSCRQIVNNLALKDEACKSLNFETQSLIDG